MPRVMPAHRQNSCKALSRCVTAIRTITLQNLNLERAHVLTAIVLLTSSLKSPIHRALTAVGFVLSVDVGRASLVVGTLPVGGGGAAETRDGWIGLDDPKSEIRI